MAEAETKPDGTQANQAAAESKPAPFWRRLHPKRLLTVRTLGIVAASSLALNVVGYALIRARLANPPPPPSPEIALGTYEFRDDGLRPSGVVSARFNLHVSLIKEAEKSGRVQLADAKFRVQQDVEELLRKAHGADFEDPALADLKRQLQEQINQTLGARAVSSVIITDLAVHRTQPPAADHDAAESGEPTPHESAETDKPSHASSNDIIEDVVSRPKEPSN